MRPVTITKSLSAAVVDSIATAQALAAAGNLALVGGGTVTLDTQRRVSILSAGNDSGLTWTVRGTNGAGSVITEAVAGGNAVAVATLQDFLTITRVSANGAVATTVQVGTNGTGSTPWFIPDSFIANFLIGIETELQSGAATWSIEVTQDDPKMPLPIYQAGYSQSLPVPVPYAWPGLSGLMGNASGAITAPIAAWRQTISAGTGVVRTTAIQSGISAP